MVCACAALGVAFAGRAAADDVSGKWKVTSKSPRGERVYDMTLAQSGEKVTVTSKDREGNDVKSEGPRRRGDHLTTKRQNAGRDGDRSLRQDRRQEMAWCAGVRPIKSESGQIDSQRGHAKALRGAAFWLAARQGARRPVRVALWFDGPPSRPTAAPASGALCCWSAGSSWAGGLARDLRSPPPPRLCSRGGCHPAVERAAGWRTARNAHRRGRGSVARSRASAPDYRSETRLMTSAGDPPL
jgi:hypothetical protein